MEVLEQHATWTSDPHVDQSGTLSFLDDWAKLLSYLKVALSQIGLLH